MMDKDMDDISIDERRKIIVNLLNRNGRVRVTELSRQFNISEVTIRGDLTMLEEAGLAERVHGGAVPTQKALSTVTLEGLMRIHEEDKKRIAVKVASLIAEGDTVMVSTGSTPLYVAREINSLRNLTVVTNSVSVARELGNSTIHVILLGGLYDAQYQFTYGDDTLSQLRKYKANKLILSADGITVGEGVTSHIHLDAEINRRMIERANRIILAADESKLGRVSFVQIAGLDSIDCLVTSASGSDETLAAAQEMGVEVHCV